MKLTFQTIKKSYKLSISITTTTTTTTTTAAVAAAVAAAISTITTTTTTTTITTTTTTNMKEVMAYETSCHRDIRALQRVALNVHVERNVSSDSHQKQTLGYGKLNRITSPNVDLNQANRYSHRGDLYEIYFNNYDYICICILHKHLNLSKMKHYRKRLGTLT